MDCPCSMVKAPKGRPPVLSCECNAAPPEPEVPDGEEQYQWPDIGQQQDPQSSGGGVPTKQASAVVLALLASWVWPMLNHSMAHAGTASTSAGLGAHRRKLKKNVSPAARYRRRSASVRFAEFLS